MSYNDWLAQDISKAYLVNGRAQRSQHVQAFDVNFSAVSLTGHCILLLEPSHPGDQLVQLFHLLPITFEVVEVF